MGKQYFMYLFLFTYLATIVSKRIKQIIYIYMRIYLSCVIDLLAFNLAMQDIIFYLCSTMRSACIHTCMALFYTFHQSCMMMRMLITATTTFATVF